MPFPGESLAVTSRTNLVGTPITNAGEIQRHAGLSVFAAGDSAQVTVALSPWLLAPGDEAVVSWVVIVAAGSGTLDLSETHSATTVSLGSHAVTGPQTLVVPSSLLDAADVVAGGSASLTVTASSGPVSLEQIKLRVWPPDGPLGGWSAPYTREPFRLNVNSVMSATGGLFPTTGADHEITGSDSAEDALADVQLAINSGLAGQTFGTYVEYNPTTPGEGQGFVAAAAHWAYGQDVGEFVPVRTGLGHVGAGAVYIARRDVSGIQYEPTSTWGVDWIYPPDEIPDDPNWPTVGPDAWAWAQGDVTVEILDLADDLQPYDVKIDTALVDGLDGLTGPLTWDDIIPASGTTIATFDAAGTRATLTLPLPGDGQYTRVVIWPHAYRAPAPKAFEGVVGDGEWVSTGQGDADLIAGVYGEADVLNVLAYWWTPPPFLYWSPSGPARVPPLRQRNRGRGRARLRAARQDSPRQRGFL